MASSTHESGPQALAELAAAGGKCLRARHGKYRKEQQKCDE